MIADEPIAGLDPRHALDTVTRLRALAAEGRLVVVALHDLTLALRFSTHVMALKAGRLAAFGPTGSVLTAGLLREVFEVEARIAGEGVGAYVDYLGPLAVNRWAAMARGRGPSPGASRRSALSSLAPGLG